MNRPTHPYPRPSIRHTTIDRHAPTSLRAHEQEPSAPRANGIERAAYGTAHLETWPRRTTTTTTAERMYRARQERREARRLQRLAPRSPTPQQQQEEEEEEEAELIRPYGCDWIGSAPSNRRNGSVAASLPDNVHTIDSFPTARRRPLAGSPSLPAGEDVEMHDGLGSYSSRQQNGGTRGGGYVLGGSRANPLLSLREAAGSAAEARLRAMRARGRPGYRRRRRNRVSLEDPNRLGYSYRDELAVRAGAGDAQGQAVEDRGVMRRLGRWLNGG